MLGHQRVLRGLGGNGWRIRLGPEARSRHVCAAATCAVQPLRCTIPRERARMQRSCQFRDRVMRGVHICHAGQSLLVATIAPQLAPIVTLLAIMPTQPTEVPMSEMTREQMLAQMAAMQAQIDAMKADAARKLTLKVSERGVVCVYGLGQRPVSLYASQWEALIPFVKSGAVERFITANAALVARKASATV